MATVADGTLPHELPPAPAADDPEAAFAEGGWRCTEGRARVLQPAMAVRALSEADLAALARVAEGDGGGDADNDGGEARPERGGGGVDQSLVELMKEMHVKNNNV